MGYYIDVRVDDKVKYICDNYSGVEVCQNDAVKAMKDSNKAVIVVVQNPTFQAAAFAFDEKEFKHFIFDDGRLKYYIIIDRKLACKLTGYEDEH